MDQDNKSIYLLDMSRCTPAEAISTDLDHAKWVTAPYTIAAGEGHMLFCPPHPEAPVLSFPLEVPAGWYHIYIGTYRPTLFFDTCLLLKLQSDPCWTRSVPETFRPEKDLVAPDMRAGQADITEAFWKTVYLDQETLMLYRANNGSMANTLANIAYVHLMAATTEEQAQTEHDGQRTDTRRLIANFDGGQHHMWAYGSQAEMADEFHALAQSDFKIALWGVARSFATFYPSQVASEMEWTPHLPGVVHNGWTALQRRRENNIDLLKLAVQCAHDVGVEIYPQVRMSGDRLPPIHRSFSGPGQFQRDHPEWLCLTPEGYKTRHLSQAFPEVRAEYVALFREWVETYEADGVCIVFCRSWPYVLYEAPVLESFQAHHGISMQDLDFFDRRVLAHRASFLTQLLRDTRTMLDEVGAKRGKHLGTSYIVPASGYTPTGCPDLGPFTSPVSRAMDVEAWVKEGLVDHLIAHIESVGAPDGSDGADILKPYVDLARGTNTQIYADLYPRRQSADSMRRRAQTCYEAGVDGLSFWDCQGRALRLSGWAMHRMLGHRNELSEMQAFADRLFHIEPMITFDGFRMQNEFCIPTDG